MVLRAAAGKGADALFVFFALLVPGVLIWVLCGEFDVLNLDWLHAAGGSTGLCYADATGATAVQCAAGTKLLLYGASRVDWRLGVVVGSFLIYAALAAVLAVKLNWASARMPPYACATALLASAIALSGALPDPGAPWIVLARIAIAIAAALLGFYGANRATNAWLVRTPQGDAAFAAVVKDMDQSKREAARRKQDRSSGGLDKDYVDDVKN